MNQTNFEINGNVLIVTRVFNADITIVWKAWTEAELLDQWWAPKPWKSETSYMDFKIGGYRLYAMIGPENEKHLGRTDYLSIYINQNFSGEDAFCDQNGNINPTLPVAKFTNQFESKSGKTLVTIITEYASAEHLKRILEMGMKEGLSMAFENLDVVLNQLTPQ